MEKFTHLHVHTEYSVQDGASRIKDLVKKAVADNMEAIAITDHGNMFGTTEMYKECKKQGIKPILGCEVYIEDYFGGKNNNHLVLLAKNRIGYRNLSVIVSNAWGNFNRRPKVNWEDLRNYSEGIICLSACIGGEIPRQIISDELDKAKEITLAYKEIFGDDFYLEIQRHGISVEEMVNKKLLKFSKEFGIKVVATGDTHYTNEEDRDLQEILLCLQTGKTINDYDRMVFEGDGYHFQTKSEMFQRFYDMPEVLTNTQEIVDKIDLELSLNEVSMPKFDVPEGFKDEATYFEYLSREGFRQRFEGTEAYTNKEYLDRLDYEIEMINSMKFDGYFLIVQDFIMYAKNRGIMVGPGRGSCVGSLVAYCLQITDLDPIPLNLLFERFLNPERVSNPDMDIDFEYERRDEVLDYVIKKYGTEAVCGIITFGTFGAKGSVRDVARVLEYSYSVGDKIAKAIPVDVNMTLSKALEVSDTLREMYENDMEVKEVIDVAKGIEGLVRHTSTHACGKVIAPSKVVDFMPEAQILDKKKKERVRVSQMTDVEEMGLLKFDFLGLRTMSVIGNSIKLINKKRAHENKSEIKYLDIKLTDTNVFDYLSEGDTFGVFQLESAGMRQLMKDMFYDVDSRVASMKKANATDEELSVFGFELFERLVSAVSLYRPGPLDYIPQYLDGMRNPDDIIYDCPEIEEILKPTYGTIVYQEQVQMIVRKLAGYSLGRGDLIRRAMGKKKADIMEQEKEYFINGKLDDDGNIEVMGCVRNGISEEIASIIWHKMEDFAKYAFNKSHAAAYAMIAYVTAWLKHYYPVEFMTATLNSYINSSDKIKVYISVCMKMGIEILPPDVNKSEAYFSVEGENAIRFGLMGIKHMGKSSLLVLDERKKSDFLSYQDFAERMAVFQKLSKKDLDAVIYSGAMDIFEGTRRAKFEILPQILSSAKTEKDNHNSGQISLFNINAELAEMKIIKTPDLEEYHKKFKLDMEKEYAGFYVTEHPLDDYEKYFVNQGVSEIALYSSVDTEDDSDDNLGLEIISYEFNNSPIKVAGLIKDVRKYYTKKDHKPLYVFDVEDRTGTIGAVMFSSNLEFNEDKIIEDAVVIIEGKIKHDDKGVQLIASKIYDIEALANTDTPKSIKVKAIDVKQLNALNELIKEIPGDIPVFATLNGKTLKATNGIGYSLATYMKLQAIFGEGVSIVYPSKGSVA